MQEVIERGVADAIRRGRFDEAASVGLRGYGPEILGFLVAIGPSTAEDAFSQFCEDMWRALPAFRAQASFRNLGLHARAPRCLAHQARPLLAPPRPALGARDHLGHRGGAALVDGFLPRHTRA